MVALSAVLVPAGIVAAVGVLSGLLLSVAAKYMAVPVDERVVSLQEIMPGANCGACGFAGCNEYAEKIVTEGVKTTLCPPGGAELVKNISEVMGGDAEEVVPLTAVVCCAGTTNSTQQSLQYEGPRTCIASNTLYNGQGSCNYSCLLW